MNLKYIIFAFLLPALLITSCKREEDHIFEENASVRMTEAIANAYEVLQGSEGGWVMTYYPSDNQEFGGYTIFTKFISNAQVTIVSDGVETPETSTYAVVHETGPVLTFNGYNKAIHWFSEPGIDNGGIGADDTGMKGDFEFIVLKATADSVILKSKKSGTEVVMLPLSASQFEQQTEVYREAAVHFDQFGVFTLEDASGNLFDMSYRWPIRIIRNPKDASGRQLSFRAVPDGLEFYEEYQIDGVAFDHLRYVEPTNDYAYGYYTDENNTFKLIVEPTPLNLWFAQNIWSFAYNGVGPLGRGYWDQARAMLAANNITVDYMRLGDFGISGISVDIIMYNLQGNTVTGAIGHDISRISGTDDQIRIDFTGQLWNINSSGFSTAYWSGGLNQFTTPLNGRTFIVTADTDVRPTTVKLVDTVLPTNTFIVTLDPIADPLNN